eukprot:scaffold189520_cov47-Prasinocladus_malaysianus.AAC.1
MFGTWTADFAAAERQPRTMQENGILGSFLPLERHKFSIAKAMLLSGKGDAAHWSEVYEAAGGDLHALDGHTELSFAPDCKNDFCMGENISLKVDAKNCRSILVKVRRVLHCQ